MPKQWSYVPTAQNPADIGCRGVTAGELLKLQRW